MTQLVVPGVVRCALAGLYLSKPLVNTLDIFVSGPARSASEAATGNPVQDALISLHYSWSKNVLPVLGSAYTVDRIDYVDLDSPTGITGSFSGPTVEPAWPRPGGGGAGGQPYTAMAATLVRKQVASQRGQRSGRLFICPPGESGVDAGLITAEHLTALRGAFTAFLADATGEGPDGSEFYPVVVHTNPALTAPSFSRITGLPVDERLGTQRRRNRS